MDRSKMKILLAAATVFFFVVAIVLFILGFAIDDISTLPKVLLIVLAVICIALTGELGFFTYLMMDTDPNYFLYSPQVKRNISVQNLTFQTVNMRMNKFLSGYASSEGRIWLDRVLDNPYLDMPSEFKPLVAYKLLYGVAESDTDAGWQCIESASDDTLKFIYNGLSENNDLEFASRLQMFMSEKPMNMTFVRDYLVRNKKYMQSKMMRYVVDNIEKF